MNSLLVFLIILGITSPLQAENKDPFDYYVILWGYQDGVNSVHGSHTFATYVKARGTAIVDKADISWLPDPNFLTRFENRRERFPLIRSVPGMNLTTEATIADATRRGLTIGRFGPYKSTKEVFERAKFDSQNWNGQKWKMLDNLTRPSAENCIHKVSDIVGPLRTGTLRGIPATDAVREHYIRNGAIIGTETYPWVYDALFGIPRTQNPRDTGTH